MDVFTIEWSNNQARNKTQELGSTSHKPDLEQERKIKMHETIDTRSKMHNQETILTSKKQGQQDTRTTSTVRYIE